MFISDYFQFKGHFLENSDVSLFQGLNPTVVFFTYLVKYMNFSAGHLTYQCEDHIYHGIPTQPNTHDTSLPLILLKICRHTNIKHTQCCCTLV